MPIITELWNSSEPTVWTQALDRYWRFVKPENLAIERALDRLDLNRLRQLTPEGWYEFLRTEYFRWKYTAPNRYKTTTNSLAQYKSMPDGLEHLHRILKRLLSDDNGNVRDGISTAKEIRGLGTAGATGLLSLMYPTKYATVDQFVVLALREIPNLPETVALTRMKPTSLTVSNGVTLIGIMTRKAYDLNRLLGTSVWTPRKLDQVLWTASR